MTVGFVIIMISCKRDREESRRGQDLAALGLLRQRRTRGHALREAADPGCDARARVEGNQFAQGWIECRQIYAVCFHLIRTHRVIHSVKADDWLSPTGARRFESEIA